MADKDTAQWNADKLQGVSVSASAPSSGQVLKYNGTAWAPATDDTGGGGSLTDGDKGDITVSSSGTVWTIDNSAVTNAKIATGIDATKLADGSVTNTEFQYIGTLTSDAQTQLNGKAASSHTHTASEITDFSEAVDDRVSSLVVAGTGITSTYNDVANTLTVATTITQYTDEMAQDAIGAMVDSSLTYVDATPLLQRAALTGDVTASAGSNTTAIANSAVTNAKMANMAADTIKGNNTGGAAAPSDLTATQVKTLLAIANTDVSGLGTMSTQNASAVAITGGSATLSNTGLSLRDTDASHTLSIVPGSNLTANRTLTLTTGDASRTLTISGDATISGTTSGTNTGDQNLFSTIAVSGQSNVVADSTSDTLTLVAGSNVTITTDAATDSITIAASGSGGVTDGDKGDITVSASGATWTIDNDTVTYAKIQNVTDARLLGRSAGSSGDCQEITVGSGLSLSGGSLTATGGGTGDVVGPASATDNALARFDTTTGKLIQNSASALSDDGALTLANNSGANTGMVSAYNWIRLANDYTLTSTTSAQKLFNASTNGALTLPTGVYFFESLLYLTTMSATSGNAAFHLLGAGTATLARILYQGVGKDSTTPLATNTHSGAASDTQNSAASILVVGVGTGMEVSLRGTFDVTTGGTLIPSVALVTAAAAVVKKGSYFKCWRAGDTATNTLGAWT